jgi:YadA-like membrane anchor domain
LFLQALYSVFRHMRHQDLDSLIRIILQSLEKFRSSDCFDVQPLPDNKTFAVSAHWGTFRGENALGVSAFVRVNEFVWVDGGVGAGLREGGVGGRAGLTVAW